MLEVIHLHQKIGSWVKQQRMEKNLDIETVARQLEIEVQLLHKYESGAASIRGAEFAKMIMLYQPEPQIVVLFLNELRTRNRRSCKK